ncbi:LLM class flavin-dependent oxidoreductase [Streptomyces sp. NPDC005761]|uniref:LLM class flavin-dependent oxidoreductase n=2 Tax=unclassified Streptomyces TaxID=2593676 RepID=UPI0033C8082F
MELGVFSLSDILPGSPDTAAGRTDDIIGYGVLAEQHGLDVFGIGEHHTRQFTVPSPAVVHAAIARSTSRIKLTTTATVLSVLDPVRVFQGFATLDLVSHGRAEIIAGRSAFAEPFALFGEEISQQILDLKSELGSTGSSARSTSAACRPRWSARPSSGSGTSSPHPSATSSPPEPREPQGRRSCMNVTVFGATGAIGALTVTELLERGHQVTAYARNPQKVPATWGDRVRVVIGEVSDKDAIDSAVAGADAVISALGPSMDRKATGTPLVAGTRNIVDAMKHHKVRRYIGHATPAVLDPQEKPTPVTRLIGFMPRTFMRRAYDEITGMSDLIKQSGLDWTIIRFIAPKNTPKQLKVRVGFFGTDKLGFAVSRADIAALTAAQVDDDTYIGRAPAISN